MSHQRLAEQLADALMFRKEKDVLRALLQGANVNARVAIGPGFLSAYSYPVCLAVGAPDLLLAVLRAGANPNVSDSNGSSPLEFAIATYDSVSEVSVLLAHGADPNFRDPNGYTPLMVSSGNNQIAALLLRVGADPNAFTNTGWSALMAASVQGDARLVQILINTGADPNHVDDDGLTTLMHAKKNGRTENAKVLEKYIRQNSGQIGNFLPKLF